MWNFFWTAQTLGRIIKSDGGRIKCECQISPIAWALLAVLVICAFFVTTHPDLFHQMANYQKTE